jgi:hypothetical protein
MERPFLLAGRAAVQSDGVLNSKIPCRLADLAKARWLPFRAVSCLYSSLVTTGLHTIGRAFL